MNECFGEQKDFEGVFCFTLWATCCNLYSSWCSYESVEAKVSIYIDGVGSSF